MQVLRQLPQVRDPNLLVGAATADDAGVYRIDRDRALVQTVDFFTPIVDDPFVYGQIAAANALSDVYAMGGRPLTAMNLLGVPTDVVPPNVVGAELAEGGLVRAGTDVTGYGLLGHVGSICRASGVGAEIDATRVPVLSDEVFELIEKDCIPGGSRENLKTANEITEWHRPTEAQKILLADAQTSGGLLLCVRPRLLSDVLGVLKKGRTLCAKVIGRIVNATKPNIFVVSNRE